MSQQERVVDHHEEGMDRRVRVFYQVSVFSESVDEGERQPLARILFTQTPHKSTDGTDTERLLMTFGFV